MWRMRYLLIGILLLSGLSFSASMDQLIIELKNDGSRDCVLQKYWVLYGHVSDHTKVPNVLFRAQSASFIMRGGLSYHKSILLTYVCDVEQEITLFVDTLPELIGDSVIGKVCDAKRMSAQYTTRNTHGFYINTPMEIHWVISQI